MAEASAVTQRPDLDIHEDIEGVIVQYPPMVNDRHHVKVHVENSVVTLVGHLKTSITRNYLLETIPTVKGVVRVDTSQLYDDESTRLEIASLIPVGVFANIEYGVVILSGKLPQGTNESDLVQKIKAVPGARLVISRFI